ncbi:hypothetical protein AB0D65_16145 [Streptomyces griseoloalbus]|uniref:Uncharacterized protein n=1 Tax=Streptomyces griseoloalbus TaxID=67303 RepID=A0ABV3E5R6_9ACTN
MSYDESAVWRPVADFGAGRLVLDHPRGANSVWLRVHLTEPRTTGR